MVDGALGMGFGPTSASILLNGGLSPSAVSTTVNVAKVASGLAAGLSHWRFGNIDRQLVLRLAIPGCAGALAGATILRRVNGDTLRPVLAALLILIALRILFRFRRPLPASAFAANSWRSQEGPGAAVVPLAGAIGGVTNGLIGAWGPVVTPVLLQRGVTPRYAVGSANTAEIAVAAVAAGTLISAASNGELKAGVLLAMLIGGVAAAPLAAWLTRHLPPRPMGLAVAALLLVLNVRELAGWADLGPARWYFYAGVLSLTAAAAAAPTLQSPRASYG